MSVIWMNRGEPGDNRFYMIDEDFSISDIPTILGSEDRVGCMVCNKNMSAIYTRNSEGWTQVSDTSTSGHMFLATYGVTTYQEIKDAYYDKKVCFVLHPTEKYLGMLIEESNNRFHFVCPKSTGNLVLAVTNTNKWSNTWYSLYESAGNGIEVAHSSTIDEKTTISTKIDNSTIKFNSSGQMYADSITEKEWTLKGQMTTETKTQTIALDLTGYTELYLDIEHVATTSTNLNLKDSNGKYYPFAAEINYKKIKIFIKNTDFGAHTITSRKNSGSDNYWRAADGIYIQNGISSIIGFSYGNPNVITSCNIKIYAR